MKTFKTTLLLSVERIVRAGAGFAVSILITKAYGVSAYGEYAYCLAVMNIISVACSIGLDDYFVKESAEKKGVDSKLLVIRLILTVLAFIICCIFIDIKIDDNIFLLVSVMSLTYIWNTLYLILAVRDATRKSEILLSLICITSISMLIKLFLIKHGMLIFLIMTLIENISTTIILIYATYACISDKNKSTIPVPNVLKQSIPVGISALSIILFYKIDQLLVQHYLGNAQLGIYALSASMILAAGYIQSSFVATTYGALGIAKNDLDETKKALIKAFRGAIVIGVLVYAIYFLIGRVILNVVFPDIASNLTQLLNIGVLSILFSGLAAISSQYLFLHNMSQKRLVRTLLALGFNTVWNLILIPKFGIIVAAWGYLITQILMGIVFNILDSKTKLLIECMITSLRRIK